MQPLKRIFESVHEHGLVFVLKRRLSKIRGKRIRKFNHLKHLFSDKIGLEVGGPSGIFRDKELMPIYNMVKKLDGCNFSTQTIWEGSIESGNPYQYYPNKEGIQYISEATDLRLIPNAAYDFVISSNCIEHVANPLQAIKEWIRVIKKGGVLLLAVPNKAYCFDHLRPTTPFAHLLDDFQQEVKENDLTHLNEILQWHDLTMDLPAGNLEQFKARSLKNFENRALHHHVFDLTVLKEIFSYFKLEIVRTHEGNDYIILGRKTMD